MKQDDVIIGETYLTRVSGVLVPVIVLAAVDNRGRRRRFSIKRVDNGRVLFNRTSASLRKTKKVGKAVVEDKSKKTKGLSASELEALDGIDIGVDIS